MQNPDTKRRLPSVDAHLTYKRGTTAVPFLANGEKKSVKKGDNRSEPGLTVISRLTCQILEQLKDDVYHHPREQSSDFSVTVDYDSNTRFRRTKPFVNRSLFFTFSNVDSLLQSFRNADQEEYKDSPLPHLDSKNLTHAFRDWSRQNGALIFDSLWIATEALFNAPPELDVQKSPRLKASRSIASLSAPAEQTSSSKAEERFTRYLTNEEAAHIIMICIHALTSLVPVGWPHTWVQLRKFRSWGIILPNAPAHADSTSHVSDPWLSIIDELEYEPALRLADRLVRGIGARICFERVLSTLGRTDERASSSQQFSNSSPLLDILVEHLKQVEKKALAWKRKLKGSLNYDEDPGWTVTATFMEWLRTIMIKKWDGNAIVYKWGNVGVSISLFNKFYENIESLNLRRHMFHMPYFNERLDIVKEPLEFLKRQYQPNSFHIFEFPCLFQPDYLIAYFRTINFTTMHQQYEHTERTAQLQRELDAFLRKPYWHMIRIRLDVTFTDYFVLDVRRDRPLEDTLNQLWAQERRRLLKPLKVRMGMHEGEVGLDQGGVTYEFFRVVLSEAFKPANGMFIVDDQTRMTWFRPASLEPYWKFEMLGVLFSLAVYNGITIPVTFPRALYHGLLTPDQPSANIDYPDHVDFIRDGWPTLAKSFDELLSWKEGDVADVFLRTYSFSFDAYGTSVDVDMQAFDKHPDPTRRPWPADYDGSFGRVLKGLYGEPTWRPNIELPNFISAAWERPKTTSAEENILQLGRESSPETPLVSNANRQEYVSDYIYWLTYKSVAPQVTAFRNGFRACLHDKSLSLFDSQSLKSLIEGTQDIDVSALKAATRYEDGYSTNHHTIEDFWSIVENYAMPERRKLLEFVTASDRVPITGFESMNFVIVRLGPDTEMLPSSSTCFGKLMLPEYASKEKLERKLGKALEHSQGFGVV